MALQLNFSSTFKLISQPQCGVTKARVPIPFDIADELSFSNFWSKPWLSVKIETEGYRALFLDPLTSPDTDWPTVFRFLTVVLAIMALMSYIGSWISRIARHNATCVFPCRFCAREHKNYLQIGCRNILKRLIEAKTPSELWYDVRLLSKQNGVRTVLEVQTSKNPRWRGIKPLVVPREEQETVINHDDNVTTEASTTSTGRPSKYSTEGISDEATLHFRQVFELGRTSVLREIKEKVKEGNKALDEWCNILVRCNEEDIDKSVIKSWRKETPPVYEAYR